MSTGDEPDWEEYGLFIGADGLRATDLPWRLGDYTEQLPLSDSQIEGLAASHKLDPSILQALSQRLGYVLNPSQNIHVVRASRSKGKMRASDDLNYCKAQLKTTTARMEEVFNRLANLTMDTDGNSPLLLGYSNMLELLERAHLAMIEGQTALQEIAKRPELFLKLEPVDRRVLHDRRRNDVLSAIFQAWVETGRKVSFTTDPVTSKRGGPLVMFTQDVCAKLTDPPTEIGGETIAKLIVKQGKHYRPMAEWLSVFHDLKK
jgi:hypothetical protein